MERIRIPQGEIEVREVGRGAPIVFVHGLLVDGELWRKVVPRLSAAYRCIVPTWPFGSHRVPMAEAADLSPPGMADVVLAALDALDLRDVTLVGNDSGGAICQMVCAKRPARVGRLVLTNCDAFEVFPPPGFGYLKLIPRIPGLTWAMTRAMLRVPRLRRMRIAYGALTVRPLDEDLTRRWVEPSATQREIRRDLTKFLRGVSVEHTLAAAAALAGFDRPTLLAWGKDDRFFPVKLAERLAAAIPGARLELIEDAVTFVPEDQPERLATAISRFIVNGGGAAA
jgi:pimeloyl-ACP methyl ester carboxylesterase